MVLTDEQKKRMEENRLKALAKRQEKKTTAATPVTNATKPTNATTVTAPQSVRPSMPNSFARNDLSVYFVIKSNSSVTYNGRLTND